MQLFFRIMVSILLLGFVVAHVGDVRDLLRSFRPDPVLLIFTFVVTLTAFYLSAYKWKFISEGVFKESLLARTGFRLQLVGFFYGFFLPGGQLTGEGAKAAYLAREEGMKQSLLFAQLTDRFTGLMSASILGIIAFWQSPSLWGDPVSVVACFCLAGFLLVSTIFVISPQIARSVVALLPTNAKSFVSTYGINGITHGQQKVFVGAIAVGLVVYLLSAGAFVFIAKHYYASLHMWYAYWMYIIFSVLVFLPISYAGFGVREATFAYYMLKVGASSSHVIAISAMFFIVQASIALVGGWIVLVHIWKSHSLLRG